MSAAEAVKTVKVNLDDGTPHFQHKHRSDPPENDNGERLVWGDPNWSQKVTQILEINANPEPRTVGRSDTDVRFNARVQQWNWVELGGGKYIKVGVENKKIQVKGELRGNDLINFTWDPTGQPN